MDALRRHDQVAVTLDLHPAQEQWGESTTMKAAWFWAVEDWWEDDTGGVFSTNRSTAWPGNSAAWVRDNISHSSPRRPLNFTPTEYAWSYHDG